MLARKEVDVRHPLGIERGLVAAARRPGDLREMEAVGPIDLVQERAEARARAHAVDRQGVLAEPADHVQVDHGDGLADGHDGIVHIVAAAPKPPFLAREKKEDTVRCSFCGRWARVRAISSTTASPEALSSAPW